MLYFNLLHILCSLLMGGLTLFDFNKNCDLTNWRVVDDVVMGGYSDSFLEINSEGAGLFYGDVSLRNNGGFSSVRYRFDKEKIVNYTNVILRLKGDGKKYQFRIKSDKSDSHSYIYHFLTSGEWEHIIIPLSEMAPRFRGRNLSLPNYPGIEMEEISFLISNKKEESFTLEIDRISLE